MPTYFCHPCAAARGYIRKPPEPADLLTSTFQLDNYMKHTVPDPKYPVQSVFTSTSTEMYASYIVDGMAAGWVEIDDLSRINIIWNARQPTGKLYEHGIFKLPEELVKIVLTSSTGAIHAFPFPSTDVHQVTCADCGRQGVLSST